MINLKEIENDLLNKQQELNQQVEETSNIENEYNENLKSIESNYQEEVNKIQTEIERLEGMRKTSTPESTEEEIDDINANNEEVDAKIEKYKQDLQELNKNYQNSKEELLEERKQKESKNINDKENLKQNIDNAKKQLLEAINQNREEAKQQEQEAKQQEEEAYEKFRAKNKQIRKTRKNISSLTLSLESLKSVENDKTEEPRKQILKIRKSEMQKLRNFAKSRAKLWDVYNEAYKNRQQAEKNTENVMKETEELIAKYSLNTELEKDIEINPEEPEKQKQKAEETKEDGKNETEKKNILGYTAESLENETQRLKKEIREIFEIRGIAEGSDLENKINQRIDKQYILFSQVLNNPKSSKKQTEKISKEFEKYKAWDINDIIKDVLLVQKQFNNKEDLLKTVEQLGVMVLETNNPSKDNSKGQKSNTTVKQNSEQQETPKQGAKPKERANTSINFTKQDVKDLFQKQKNAINQFFESKGIKENNKSIIRDKMLSGSKITEEQLIKALDDVEYYDIDKLNEIFAEEKDAVEEYFKDDKNVAKILDDYLDKTLMLIQNGRFDKKSKELVIKEYNDILIEAKGLQIPVDDKFKFIEETKKVNTKQTTQVAKQNTQRPSNSKSESKQKTETKAQQGEPKEKIINTQNGENRDSLINEYNSLVKETKRLDIINEKEIIEETQKLDLEKITFFAKAGLYHFNFSDGTAISVDELERLKKKEIESTKKYLEKEHDMSLLRKTPDYILIEALRYAILKRNEYFEAKDRLDVDTMLDEKIQKYIDGIRDEYIGKSFSEIIYDNISEITEIEDFNSKSLNANEIELGLPRISQRIEIRKILKFANEIEGIRVLGPVGRFGRIKYFIQSQILKKAIGAPERYKQLKEEGDKIKTKKDTNNINQEDFQSRIEATKEQKKETEKIGKEAAQKQANGTEIPDAEWKEVSDDSQITN